MRFRFLIADLMVLVVPVAAAAYAYRTDPKLLGHAAFAAFLVMTCLASLGAKFRRGNRPMKMFWKGFALFGWAYFIFGLWFGLVEERLLTHSILGMAFALVGAYATRRLVVRTCPAPIAPGPVIPR